MEFMDRAKVDFSEVTPRSIQWKESGSDLLLAGIAILVCGFIITLATFSYREMVCESSPQHGQVHCALSTQGVMAGPPRAVSGHEIDSFRVRTTTTGNETFPSYRLEMRLRQGGSVRIASGRSGSALDRDKATLDAVVFQGHPGPVTVTNDGRPWALFLFLFSTGLGFFTLGRAKTREVHFDGGAHLLRLRDKSLLGQYSEEIPFYQISRWKMVVKPHRDEAPRFQVVLSMKDGEEKKLIHRTVEEKVIHRNLEESLRAMGLEGERVG